MGYGYSITYIQKGDHMTLLDIFNPETLFIFLAAYGCIFVMVTNYIEETGTRMMILSDARAFNDRIGLAKLYHKSNGYRMLA